MGEGRAQHKHDLKADLQNGGEGRTGRQEDRGRERGGMKREKYRKIEGGREGGVKREKYRKIEGGRERWGGWVKTGKYTVNEETNLDYHFTSR